MLKSLVIRNFALIAELNLDFHAGLNLITGETGAGKSILMDSLGFVLGAKADADCVRGGEEQARVSAVFETPPILAARLDAYLESKGVPKAPDLTLKREMAASGRGRAWINDEPASLATLAGLGDLLVDFHGQHEHQSLLRPATYLDLLDSFGGFQAERDQVGLLFNRLKQLEDEQKALQLSEQERERQLDLLRFQIQELEAARLKPGEEAGLLGERDLLASAEKRAKAAAAVHAAFCGDESNPGAQGSLGQATQAFKDLAGLDTSLEPMRKRLAELKIELDDAASQLRTYLDGIVYDPKRLEEIEERLALLAKLKKKYGADEAVMTAFLQQARAKADSLGSLEAEQKRVQASLDAAGRELDVAARALSARRAQAGGNFGRQVTSQLRDLGMEKAAFEVMLRERECGPLGIDQAEFLLAPNPGEDARPLAKIASGGELSRIMLSVKTVLFNLDPVETLVFDEVDAGISGRVAQVVGEKLAALARSRQVLCITHLPQIACQPCHHFKVSKEVRQAKTYTVIKEMGPQERIREIATLLDGAAPTESGLAHARQLLSLAAGQGGHA